jgi:hypothetical protein
MIWNDIYRRQKGNDYDQKTKMLKDLYITLDRVKRVHMNGDMKTIELRSTFSRNQMFYSIWQQP